MKKKIIIIVILVLLIVPFIYSLMSKSYDKSNMDGKFYAAEDVEFLYDLRYKNEDEIKKESVIFKKQMEAIEEAKDFIVLDLFLYNDEYDRKKMTFANQVEEMTDALIEKKKENPDMDIVFITDELNNFYGAYTQKNIKKLMENGIDVTITNQKQIRDSNPLYSGFYKFYLNWMGSPEGGRIRNLFDPKGPKISVRSFLRLLNFKANHRKVLVTDQRAIVSSSNPHDPSSNHSNVAVSFYGKAMEDLIKSELGLVVKDYPNIKSFKVESEEKSDLNLRIITEGKIYDALRENISKTQKGDKINIAIFYIADRKLLSEIAEASKRGVEVNIIADLNKDAFGIEKNGSPNRPALSELVDKNPDIKVKWYETHGEQFHTKLAFFDFSNEDARAVLGSANFTRRNIQNYNLETDVEMILPKDGRIYKEFQNYYNRIWNNEDGEYTVPIEKYYEDGFILRNLWKFQEKTGLCTW